MLVVGSPKLLGGSGLLAALFGLGAGKQPDVRSARHEEAQGGFARLAELMLFLSHGPGGGSPGGGSGVAWSLVWFLVMLLARSLMVQGFVAGFALWPGGETFVGLGRPGAGRCRSHGDSGRRQRCSWGRLIASLALGWWLMVCSSRAICPGAPWPSPSA